MWGAIVMFGLRHQPHREAESASTVSLQDHAEDSKAARTPDLPLLAAVRLVATFKLVRLTL